MKTLSVLLTDDHTLFRKGLVNLLSKEQPAWKFIEATNGSDAIDIVNSKNIDVVLLDVRMPVMDGLETARRLKADFPWVKVIVLTQYADNSLINYFISIGVNGFLIKQSEPEEVVSAIKQVYYDGFYSNSILRKSFENSLGHSNTENPKLNISQRDRKLIDLLCSGMNTKEIAGSMKLTEYTVDSYRKDLMHKTQTRNVAELVSFAYRTGIL